MVSVIKVQCPHCGIEGQLVLPAIDTLVVGPCPECNKSVLIFAGKAMPLDTELMTNGSREEIYRHLFVVLKKFIRERLDTVFTGGDSGDASGQESSGEETAQASSEPEKVRPSISEKEINEFLNKELPLLDNIHYFKTIFGK